MNFLIPETAKKIIRNLTVSGALMLSIAVVFFAPQTSSAPPTQDCSVVSGTAQAGDNCLYFYPLPLCETVPSATWAIPSGSILTSGTAPNHRVNCADLSDLPLCSQVEDSEVGYPLKNCVKECSDASFVDPDPAHVPAYVRGIDYAVHNRDCLRFCDDVEAGITADHGVNCVSRKCHQVDYVGTPTSGNIEPDPPTNCSILPCNLLVPNELNESKFGDANTSDYNYCDKSEKCFNFTQAQLPYLTPNTTCKIHDCRASCVDNATDDVSIILAKSASYIADYEMRINSGYTVGSSSEQLCTRTICKPIIQVPYRCTPQADASPVIRNTTCDATGAGAICSGGYCYKTVDCNSAANENSIHCVVGGGSEGDTVGTTDDSSINSWFYRPKPMDTATEGNGAIKNFHTNSSFSKDSVGYYVSQMRGYGWGEQASTTIPFGLLGSITIDLGYMHSSVFGDGVRSPGMATPVAKLGNRGLGIGYLCGMHVNIYNEPYHHTAYHKGYVETTFTDTDATHVLQVCLRFTNTLAFDHSCGERECSVSCVFASDSGEGCTQLCGYDVCRTLRLKDNDPKQCVMSTTISTGGDGSTTGPGNTTRDCMKTVDGYLRLRAVKYDDRICTFVDVKGTLAYPPNDDYFDGGEKLDDGTCISGTRNDDGGCDGSKNTNDVAGEADIWRTIFQIPYIKSNQSAGEPQGYLDKSGRLFPAQECIKTSHRITIPPTPNLATIDNAAKIFIPPVYILSASTKRAGSLSSIPADQTLGDTDFHYPEITVNFGTTTQKLSLGFGKTGYEEGADVDPEGSATVTTFIDANSDATQSIEVFVRKEYNETLDRPTFCLYQRIQDVNGVYLNPLRISCVNRDYPDINNSLEKAILPSLDFRKLDVTADAANTYASSSLAFRYLSSSVNDDTCSSGNADCSAYLSISADIDETCDSTVENHKVCVKRDVCSELNVECIQNEVDLHAADIANQPTSSFIVIQNRCNKTLLPYCNSLFGISSSSAATITNPNPAGSSSTPNVYGWFNEICITSGFKEKLRNVYAHKIDSGIMGQCIIDTNRQTPGADCSQGGKAPDCPCLEYIDGAPLSATQVNRTETLHEAGLCIDMPLPQLCPAINHNLVPNSDPNDSDYVASSLNQTAYGADTSQVSGVVHISHQYRTNGSSPVPDIPVAGHAKFPQAIFGFNDVRGECKGFWKNSVNTGGNSVPPTMSCVNTGGTAAWGTVTDPCVRYSCPAVSTAGMDSNGNYQGGYGALETGENKGLSHGFANWPQTQSTDFPVTSSASSCITGFKKVGATATLTGGETNAAHAALYSNITGYTGGTSATRSCNQIGEWLTPSVNCDRITCPAISPAIPTGSGDAAAWELWRNSGGATYVAVNSARSSTLIAGSVVKSSATVSGICNNSLGFFQVGATPPTRVCDHLGNWGTVSDPCVTQCDAVTCLTYPGNCEANQSSHGFATWDQVIDVPISGERDAVFSQCVSGYEPYPYPPLRDKYGVAYAIGNCTTATCPSGTIPNDLGDDTRSSTNPERVCNSVIVVGGQANVWTGTSSDCVNTCPGYNVDPRIGAGKTEHKTSGNVSGSVGGISAISWPTTSFGAWAYVSSPSSIASHNGSQYFYGRVNGYYALARYCNPVTHQWDVPIAHCVTNNGHIKSGPNTADALATYNSPNRVVVGSQTDNGTCVSGSYSATSGSAVATPATCSYKNGTQNIDEVYFDTGGTAKCTAMCQTTGSDIFGNAVNPSATAAYIPVGTGVSSKLLLNCKADYGSDIIQGTSVNNAFDSCGRSAAGINSDRSANRPYVMCNDNGDGTGSWSGTYNDCESCRTCNTNTSGLSGDEALSFSRSCNSLGTSALGIYNTCSDDNIAANNGVQTTVSYRKKRNCNCDSDDRSLCGNIRITCHDGIYKYDSNYQNNPGCTRECGSHSQSRGGC